MTDGPGPGGQAASASRRIPKAVDAVGIVGEGGSWALIDGRDCLALAVLFSSADSAAEARRLIDEMEALLKQLPAAIEREQAARAR
jgi:hypothetical protein